MAKSKLVSVPKSYLDSLVATIETLENSYVMDQLRKSKEDVQKGRVKDAIEFLKGLQ